MAGNVSSRSLKLPNAFDDNKSYRRAVSIRILRLKLVYQTMPSSLTVNQRAPFCLLNLPNEVRNETYYHARSKVGNAITYTHRSTLDRIK